MYQAQMMRRLKDDTFLRRLQLHTLKNQAISVSGGKIGAGYLTAKDRKLLERQIIEQKMEQVVNTDRFSDLAGLDEAQLLDMLKKEKTAENRATNANYQPWEGMTHVNRKEFIERLIIQHKRRQLEENELRNDKFDLPRSPANKRAQTNVMSRRNRNRTAYMYNS